MANWSLKSNLFSTRENHFLWPTGKMKLGYFSGVLSQDSVFSWAKTTFLGKTHFNHLPLRGIQLCSQVHLSPCKPSLCLKILCYVKACHCGCEISNIKVKNLKVLLWHKPLEGSCGGRGCFKAWGSPACGCGETLYPFLQVICGSLRNSFNTLLQCTLWGGKARLL